MKKLIALTAMLTSALFAVAEEDEAYKEVAVSQAKTPVQISLASPLQLPTSDRNVCGLRFNIFYGHSLEVCGLDLGLVGTTGEDCDVTGLQLSVYNGVGGSMNGVQFGLFANRVVRSARGVQFSGLVGWNSIYFGGVQFAPFSFNGDLDGVQAGFFNWNTGITRGLRLGMINVGKAQTTGAEFGFINFADAGFDGFQCGLINLVSGSSCGCQLGLINASDDHVGAQIGLLNLNQTAPVQILPIVNVNFR